MKEIRDRNYDVQGRECLCRGCDRVFVGLSLFDKHRSDGGCVDPATCGLTLDWKGRWCGGSGEKKQFNWEINRND